MKKISLFIAMSLDGYIADRKGSVDWLGGQGNDEDNKDVYSEFVKDMDTVIMGWNTYHQIVTELSPDEWVYNNFTTYVITHQPKPSSDKIRFTSESPAVLLKRLREENGKGIWICGGAALIQQLVREDMIDCYYITVIPTILGSGIRLFEKTDHEIKLRLLKTQSYNGMTDLVYTKREKNIIFESTLNTRSILKNSIKYIRSDVPTKISENEKNWMLLNHITTVIDLRTEKERQKKQCPLIDDSRFSYYIYPVAGGDQVPSKMDDVSKSYMNMVDKEFDDLIDFLLTADSNVLYFCNAGKDRTKSGSRYRSHYTTQTIYQGIS